MRERSAITFAVCLAGILVVAASPASAGVLNPIATLYTNAMAGFETKAATLSSQLFFSLVILDVLWLGYECTHAGQTAEGLVDTVKQRFVTYALGAYVISQQTTIVDSVRSAINQIQGLYVFGGGTLTPDGIAVMGYNLATSLPTSIPSPNPLLTAALIFPEFICTWSIQLSYAIIAVDDLVINICLQLCIIGSSFLLAFVATRWTRWISGMWVKMCVSAALLNLAIGLTVGLGQTITAEMNTIIKGMATASFNGVVSDLSTLAVCGAVFLLIGLGLTALAAFMGAMTPASAGASIAGAIAGAIGYAVGFMSGSNNSSSKSGGSSDPVADIVAATDLAA